MDIHDKLDKKTNDLLRQFNLNLTQISYIVAIKNSPRQQLTMKELERHFCVSQPTVVGVVAKLVESGFVEAKVSQKDRRVKIVSLTPMGDDLGTVASVAVKEWEDTLLQDVSPEERALFHKLLLKAQENAEYDDSRFKRRVIMRLQKENIHTNIQIHDF